MDPFAGWKTYIAAAGLFGLAVYQFSLQEYTQAYQSFMAAIAAFGLKKAIDRK